MASAYAPGVLPLLNVLFGSQQSLPARTANTNAMSTRPAVLEQLPCFNGSTVVAISGLVSMTAALRSRRRARTQLHYRVTLQTPSGEHSFECPEGTFIVSKAEEEGLELPYSCLTGQCSICTGRVLKGTIDQSSQTFLRPDQLAEDYCLTCVTTPTSDVTIQTHCDSDVAPVKVSEEEKADAADLGLFGDPADDDDDDFL
mmetsp:Transcript_131052/g.261451  ORF Transcript_131052/g.261451 Transcript_131052/m.261451 type:complete len:200 (-) Transcript_131052:90-689(-)